MIDIAKAKEALDNLDDYARMETGVNAIGPRKVLEDFIAAVEEAITNAHREGYGDHKALIQECMLATNTWDEAALLAARKEGALEREAHLMQSHADLMDAASAKHRIAQAERDRDHWKANHDNVVARLAIATQRPDLPVDRIPAIKELERLQALLSSTAQPLQQGSLRTTSTYDYVNAEVAKELQATPAQATPKGISMKEVIARHEQDPVRLAALQKVRDARLAARIAKGYESGSFMGHPDDEGVTVSLHYDSLASAEVAFNAIADAVDKVLETKRLQASQN